VPEPMLASSRTGSAEQVLAQLGREPGRWWFELKFDGIRALVERSADGAVRITNRNMVSITHRYPDVVARLEVLPFEGTLDGEIICVRADGRPDFPAVHKRDAQSSAAAIRRLATQLPAAFVPFDVLDADGQDLRGLPYVQRRTALAELWPGEPGELSIASQDAQTMWEFVSAHRLEGLVAKSGESRYVAGRSRSWVKIKATKRALVIAGSIAADKAALVMQVWDGGQLKTVGQVGSGMSVRDWTAIRGLFTQGTPQVVVEVEYLEVARGGQLRQPVFRGIRSDIPPEDCTVERLRG
jgi:bifunctional non-homologous end joining protein LigD